MPLARRVRAGVLGRGASTLLGGGVALARSVVLARLLAPDDFGLFGMALTVTGAASALTSAGLDSSLVVGKYSDEEEFARNLNTVWTVDLLRRLLVTALLLALTGASARFYADARLAPVLAVISLTPLVQGLQNPGLIILWKKVSFGRLVRFEQATNLLAAASAVALAFWTRSVWALAASQVFGAAGGVALSYAFHPHRPRLALDRRALRRALGFGKYVFVVGALTYVTTTFDNVVVGRELGAGLLGVYVVAYGLASLPVGVVVSVLGEVLLPAYAELKSRGRSRELEAAFARVLSTTSALLAVITVPAALVADEIVLVLYGREWAAAGAVLRVLMLVGFCRGLMQVVSPLLLALRGPRPEAAAKLFETLLFLAVLYPLVKGYGAVGAAWAGALVYAVTLANRLLLLRGPLPGAYRGLMRAAAATLVAAVAGAACGVAALALVGGAGARLAAGGLSAAAGVTLTLLWAQPSLRAELARVTTGRLSQAGLRGGAA